MLVKAEMIYSHFHFWNLSNILIFTGDDLAGSQSVSEELNVEKDVGTVSQSKLRSHPLFFGITMGLLAEIINSR